MEGAIVEGYTPVNPKARGVRMGGGSKAGNRVPQTQSPNLMRVENGGPEPRSIQLTTRAQHPPKELPNKTNATFPRSCSKDETSAKEPFYMKKVIEKQQRAIVDGRGSEATAAPSTGCCAVPAGSV